MRDLKRLHEIARVLIRYGFGDLVRRIGLAHALERAGHALHWKDAKDVAHLSPAARVRRMLEDLGPTFVKFGQVLSTRVDLFDNEWITEFEKLLDAAPPLPFESIRAQLLEDLGDELENVFSEFDPVPMAAASIAQVHRALLKDGSDVVVKIRRPGIHEVIEADLRWLVKLADHLEAEYAEFRIFHPKEVVRQLAQSLRRELDFTRECRNAERVAEQFKGYEDPFHDKRYTRKWETNNPAPPIIIIPKIHWHWVKERLCIQEFICGISGRQLEKLDQAGLDRKLLARRGARAVLKTIIEDGFFHADPHPGNVFYLSQNRMAFIDFGMMGHLADPRREQLIQLMLGLMHNEPAQVAEVLMDWTGDVAVDESALEMEIQAFVDQYQGIKLKELRLSSMLSDLVEILRQHHLALPMDLALLIKAFISLEGMGRSLDPDFEMASEALPMLTTVMHKRYTPKALFDRGLAHARQNLSLLSALPSDISRLLKTARRGRLELHIEVTHLKHVGNQLNRSANRITIGIVVAALIIGSSIVMTVSGGPQLLGLPVFGFLGFLGAFIGGVGLLFSIWKARKEE